MPRQPGPDLTQGHLYQPGIPPNEGQTARGIVPGPQNITDRSMYGSESLHQGQMSQGQDFAGQGQMPGGLDTSQLPSSQTDYVPLDQRWKKDKPVTPMSTYSSQGQRPVISRSLKPQTSQSMPSNIPQQSNVNQDQQNFYAQNLALANQDLAYGQQGAFQNQGQNDQIPPVPGNQGQFQTNQAQMYPPQQAVQSLPGSQVVMPPSSMTNTREITNTVSAVGGPVLSPGNENQDYRGMPQGNFSSQGQGQLNAYPVQGQEQMFQQRHAVGQVNRQTPSPQVQQHTPSPPTFQPQSQGHTQVPVSQTQVHHPDQTVQSSARPYQSYSPQEIQTSQQTGQQQYMGQGQSFQTVPQPPKVGQGQNFPPVLQQQVGRDQAFQSSSHQEQMGQGQMTQYVPQQQQGQSQSLQKPHQGQFSQTQYNQPTSISNFSPNQGVQQSNYDQRGIGQGLSRQYHQDQKLPSQQQPAFQQSLPGQGQIRHQDTCINQAGPQQGQNVPQGQQQISTQQQNILQQPQHYQGQQQQFNQTSQPNSIQTPYSTPNIAPGSQTVVQQPGVVTGGGQQNLKNFQQTPQQNFSHTQFSTPGISSTAGGYIQAGPRFALPQQQNQISSGQQAPFKQSVVGQGQQYPQPQLQGQGGMQPRHSSPAHSGYGVGMIQSGPSLSTPSTGTTQHNLPGQHYTGQQSSMTQPPQQSAMQPQLNNQSQNVKGFSQVPVPSQNQTNLPQVSGQGQFLQGQFIGSQPQGNAVQGQGLGQLSTTPQVQVPGYSETLVNRQFTQSKMGQGMSSQQFGPVPASQGPQVFTQSHFQSSQQQQVYTQGQQYRQQQGQAPVNQQIPSNLNQTVPPHQYGQQGQIQGQSQYVQGTSQNNLSGSLPQQQQLPPQGPVLQPQVLKPTVQSTSISSQEPNQNFSTTVSQGQGQSMLPTFQQQPVQSQQQPVTQNYQGVNPMQGNYQQGHQRPQSPVMPNIPQQNLVNNQGISLCL